LSVYLDTSVLVSLFTADDHSERAEAWLMEGHDLIVSHWVAAEFSSALSVQRRQGRITAIDVDVAERAFDSLLDSEFRVEVIGGADLLRARAIVVRDGFLKAPHALHLAIAERLGSVFATFDQTLHRAARSLGMETLD
jgi:predicted nucleic acid-binding protein